MGRIYQALDRFLPFDRYLDPLFGGQQQGVPMAPPMRQQAAPGIDPVMGFPSMPQVPQAPQIAPQTPQRAVPRKGERVSPWRVLDGVFGGKTFTESLDAERARPQEMAAREQRQQQIQQFAQTLPEHEQPMFLLDPEGWLKKNADRFAPQDPSVVGGAMVAPTYGPQGWSAAPIYTAPEKPPEAKPGGKWEKGPDAWYWVPDDGATPPKRGPALGAAPRTFAPPRVGGSGRRAPAAPSVSVPSGFVLD